MFRKEVLEAQQASWMGEIRLAAPPSTKAFAIFSLLLIAAAVSVLTVGGYTARETINGALVPTSGLLRVDSPTAGVISKVFVHEGDSVHQGDPLLEITSEKFSASLGETRTRVREQLQLERDRLQAELESRKGMANLEDDAKQTRIKLLKSELAQTDAQISLANQQAGKAQEILAKIQPLQQKGFISGIQYQQQENEVIQAQVQGKSLARERLSTERQIAELQDQLRLSPATLQDREDAIRTKLADIDRQLAESEAQRAMVLKATADGIVSTLPVRAGQAAGAGETLLSILPDGSVLQAELLLPSSAMGSLHAGMKAVLRYDAYPYQKFGRYTGTVTEISRSALTLQELQRRGVKDPGEPVYRVAVTLESPTVTTPEGPEHLKPGMTFKADILKDHHRLYEWITNPLAQIDMSDEVSA